MALSKQQVSSIRKAYHNLSKLDEKVNRAKACGIDCDEVERRRQAAMRQLLLYNEVYGNDHPEGQ
jgi:hypothetical protein